MGRSKFLVFAWVVLALWMAQVLWLSPRLGAALLEREQAAASVAASAAASRLGERRADLLSAIVATAQSPAGAAIFRPGRTAESPSAEKLEALRAALPDGDWVVSWVADAASFTAPGTGEPRPEPAAPELTPGLQAPRDGLPLRIGRAELLFFSLPVGPFTEGKPASVVWLGAPLWDAARLGAIGDQVGASAVVVTREGQVVASAGADGTRLASQAATLSPGAAAVVARGPALGSGPLAFPLFSAPGVTPAAEAPAAVAARSPILGTPYQTAIWVSTVPALMPLAHYQRTSGAMWLGVGLLSLAWALLFGRRTRVQPQTAVPATVLGPPLIAVSRTLGPLPEPPPEKEVHPEDFQFGGPGAQLPSASSDAVPDEPAHSESAPIAPLEAEPAADSALVPPWPPPIPPQPEAVPERSGQETSASDDELHFQNVYQEFLQVRERCGEGPDGLTFERFVVKLRKNREQLVQKYQCRTVRFQVYVKEGKAALKATPVRD
ncbi:MAG TPA: MXAN_5187 C-terminal domain-containing protein [Myxococcaceae bacterium]|nr:MXAN_5187 C-terminal domain-containing protein [Myxococcaceae bacterium]